MKLKFEIPHNIDILELCIRIAIATLLPWVIIRWQLMGFIFFPYYLVVTAITGYSPIKHLISLRHQSKHQYGDDQHGQQKVALKKNQALNRSKQKEAATREALLQEH